MLWSFLSVFQIVFVTNKVSVINFLRCWVAKNGMGGLFYMRRKYLEHLPQYVANRCHHVLKMKTCRMLQIIDCFPYLTTISYVIG